MADHIADMLADMMGQRGKRKTIMRRFSMNEISAVDHPAQVGAKAVIMKRDDNIFQKGGAEMGNQDDIYKSILPDNNTDLLERGIDAVAEDAGPTPLQKIAGFLKARDVAERMGKDEIVKGLEANPPTINDTDRALNELSKREQGESEDFYAAYQRVISSTFGKQLYGHRDEMVRANDNPQAYAAHRESWREAQKRDRSWQVGGE